MIYFFTNESGESSKFATQIFKFSLNLILPVFAYFHLKKNFNKLDDNKFENKFGTLYENHNVKRSTIIFSMPIFCIKRMIFALGTIFIEQPVAANIMIYMYTSLFSLGFNLTVRPLSSPSMNRIDNVNESFILVSSYFMLSFSFWLYTPND